MVEKGLSVVTTTRLTSDDGVGVAEHTKSRVSNGEESKTGNRLTLKKVVLHVHISLFLFLCSPNILS